MTNRKLRVDACQIYTGTLAMKGHRNAEWYSKEAKQLCHSAEPWNMGGPERKTPRTKYARCRWIQYNSVASIVGASWYGAGFKNRRNLAPLGAGQGERGACQDLSN